MLYDFAFFVALSWQSNYYFCPTWDQHSCHNSIRLHIRLVHGKYILTRILEGGNHTLDSSASLAARDQCFHGEFVESGFLWLRHTLPVLPIFFIVRRIHKIQPRVIGEVARCFWL